MNELFIAAIVLAIVLVALSIKRSRSTAARDMIICPNTNCGFRGPAERQARGSVAVGLALCCLFLLPGLLYFALRGGYRRLCPRCGLQMGSDG
jgi:hypothetical protein